MKLSLGVLVVAVLIFVDSLPLQAQPAVQGETRIVLRVSRRFIQRLTGVRFQKEEPINSNADGVAVAGRARVTGKFRVTLHESTTESDFDILVDGEVATQISATRRPVVVHAHGMAPFSARRRIVYRDDAFQAEKLVLDVRNHFTLDEICPLRGGLAGAATRRLAKPFVRRGLAAGDRQADDEIRAALTEPMERELDKLVEAMNEVQPMVRKAHEFVIAELKLPAEGVQSYRAATKDHLLFSVGKKGQRVATLPELDRDKHACVELWFAVSKNAAKEDRRKFMLQNWRLIVPLLRGQLERRSPELAKEIDEPLAKLLDDVHVHEAPGWHVVAFAPKIHVPVIQLP